MQLQAQASSTAGHADITAVLRLTRPTSRSGSSTSFRGQRVQSDHVSQQLVSRHQFSNTTHEPDAQADELRTAPVIYACPSSPFTSVDDLRVQAYPPSGMADPLFRPAAPPRHRPSSPLPAPPRTRRQQGAVSSQFCQDTSRRRINNNMRLATPRPVTCSAAWLATQQVSGQSVLYDNVLRRAMTCFVSIIVSATKRHHEAPRRVPSSKLGRVSARRPRRQSVNFIPTTH